MLMAINSSTAPRFQEMGWKPAVPLESNNIKCIVFQTYWSVCA
jgi:hypothetical protein